MSIQKAPRTFGLTSPQFDWQNADTKAGLSACLRAPLTRLATLNVLVAGLPGGDWKVAASSSNSWSASERYQRIFKRICLPKTKPKISI